MKEEKSTPAAEAAQSGSDPFDVEALRLDQKFAAPGVEKAIITVPVKKPERQWFVRVHPDTKFRLETAVIEVKDDNETFLVSPAVRAKLQAEVVPKLLITAMNRQGVVFLWPIRLADAEGKVNEWNRSMLEAAQMATGKWVRVVANRSLGAYEVFEAQADLPEPAWPDLDFKRILEIAFKGRLIDSLDHPVLRKLRGES